ncbi:MULTISPECIES: hypothetical protein [Streptomyces]|uniref:hypothetical protein n=1 Tax=Streptomyces TaxID=1883 RepID=UPI00163B9EAA|nr:MULTISPECIES: hypothetical protein [Streptomyces]MBC2875597.1 hypothetical protein [Streptomyces sp. TYQ1024]UBI41370.1 hypothetical protein K7I03_04705 [Streptomyces mobaraensis]UKW33868.1 hypothetical protein MCU78_04705 [Streptomyces sp. TYQ1024]
MGPGHARPGAHNHGPVPRGLAAARRPRHRHLEIPVVINGVVDRTVYNWIADGHGRSMVKNSIAPLEPDRGAVRDGIIDVNPAKITGWQRTYQQVEDELDDPCSLALRDGDALDDLAHALVARSHDQHLGWGDVVRFTACTAARIGEASGVRAQDIDRRTWMWNCCRQTTPGPGGLVDKGIKGKRRRLAPRSRAPEVHDRMDAFLTEHRFLIAPVTRQRHSP